MGYLKNNVRNALNAAAATVPTAVPALRGKKLRLRYHIKEV